MFGCRLVGNLSKLWNLQHHSSAPRRPRSDVFGGKHRGHTASELVHQQTLYSVEVIPRKSWKQTLHTSPRAHHNARGRALVLFDIQCTSMWLALEGVASRMFATRAGVLWNPLCVCNYLGTAKAQDPFTLASSSARVKMITSAPSAAPEPSEIANRGWSLARVS